MAKKNIQPDARIAAASLEELDLILAQEIAAIQNDAGRINQGMANLRAVEKRIKGFGRRVRMPQDAPGHVNILPAS
jgi:hypothetical protein